IAYCRHETQTTKSVVRIFVHRFYPQDTAALPTHPLSLHDALPICFIASSGSAETARTSYCTSMRSSASSAMAGSSAATAATGWRSEEHTSELQSRADLVCRLLLEKKNVRIFPHRFHPEESLGLPPR